MRLELVPKKICERLFINSLMNVELESNLKKVIHTIGQHKRLQVVVWLMIPSFKLGCNTRKRVHYKKIVIYLPILSVGKSTLMVDKNSLLTNIILVAFSR